DLMSNTPLRVSGVRSGAEVATADYGGTTESSALAAAASQACIPTGPQKSVVLLITFPGVPAPAITPANVVPMFFATSGRSLSEYWREASYGQTTAPGDVFGRYTLDAVYDCTQTGAMRDA